MESPSGDSVIQEYVRNKREPVLLNKSFYLGFRARTSTLLQTTKDFDTIIKTGAYPNFNQQTMHIDSTHAHSPENAELNNTMEKASQEKKAVTLIEAAIAPFLTGAVGAGIGALANKEDRSAGARRGALVGASLPLGALGGIVASGNTGALAGPLAGAALAGGITHHLTGKNKTDERPKASELSEEEILAQLNSTDLSNSEFERGFKEACVELGADREFAEGFIAQTTKEAEIAEGQYLNHVQNELSKLAEEFGENASFSISEINEFTKSMSLFKEAAEKEARMFWKGLEEELQKQGYDRDFVDGMKYELTSTELNSIIENNFEKSASMGSFLRMALSPTLWKRPGAQLKGIGAGITSGAKGVQKFVSDLAKAPGGAVTNQAGEAVMHSSAPKHIPGSRTKAYADAYEAALGAKPLAPKGQGIIDSARDSAISQGSTALRRTGDDAFQQEMYNLSREARNSGPGGAAARDALDRLGKGDFGGIAGRMGMDPTKMNQFAGMSADDIRRANIPSEDVLGAAQRYGADATASGFNMSGIPMPKMNPNVFHGGAPNRWFRFSPGKAMGYGLTGALGGSMLGPLGTVAGGLGGAALGGLGVGGAALGTGAAAAAGTYGAGKVLGLWGKDKATDLSGAPTDRNRAIPMLKNNWTGGVGGLIVASLLANQLGLQGPMAWIVPLLGGVLGYNYFPQLMNKWKDPYGYGANAVSGGAAFQNAASPITPRQP